MTPDCDQCGRPVETARADWATPTCLACLPPPERLRLVLPSVESSETAQILATRLRGLGEVRVLSVFVDPETGTVTATFSVMPVRL